MLQSFRSTAVEKTIILSRNQAHLNLRSEQAHKEFKALQTKAKKQENNSKVPQQTVSTQKEAKAKEFVQKRNLRQNIDSSKLNLWPLIHEPDSVASKVLYKKVIKLIEMLYGETDFYKSTHNPGLATALIDQMLGKKQDSFLELFPQDPTLSNVYYKMLRGTNTGYPRFEEYFLLKECKNKPPVCFPYASTPVLTAILGEKITNQILAQEKKKWEKNPKERILTQDELRQLIQKNQIEGFDLSNLNYIFSFEKPEKSLPRAYVDEKTKVMYAD